jgi:SAM-dependent methyltransferase
MRHVDPGTLEGYYGALWQSPNLSGNQPNSSETTRLHIIEGFLGQALGESPSHKPRLLDAGCGRGWLCRHLSKWGEVLGIDPLHASIDAARQCSPDLSFAVCTVDALEPSSFDLVVSSEVIEHTDDPEAYIAGLARVLVPGGRLILTTPRKEVYAAYSRIVPREQQQPVENWLDRPTLLATCRRAGLHLEAETRMYECFSFEGPWRILNSVKLNQLLNALPIVRSLWRRRKDAWALYFCAMFRKA